MTNVISPASSRVLLPHHAELMPDPRHFQSAGQILGMAGVSGAPRYVSPSVAIA
jgi:hypothetical protein